MTKYTLGWCKITSRIYWIDSLTITSVWIEIRAKTILAVDKCDINKEKQRQTANTFVLLTESNRDIRVKWKINCRKSQWNTKWQCCHSISRHFISFGTFKDDYLNTSRMSTLVKDWHRVWNSFAIKCWASNYRFKWQRYVCWTNLTNNFKG